MRCSTSVFALVLVAALAACSPAEDTPDPGTLPVEPTAAVPVDGPPDAPAEGGDTQPATVQPGTLALTGFTPATNEIYCSLYRVLDGGDQGERLFVTEIAGVPAAAGIGIDGQSVAMQQLEKTKSKGTETWTYRNANRPVQVELSLTETAVGFESRDYRGVIRITEPLAGPEISVAGTCGV